MSRAKENKKYGNKIFNAWLIILFTAIVLASIGDVMTRSDCNCQCSKPLNP